MRPVALRDDCPIRSVGTDFHSILGHNAIGNAVTRLIAQGIQNGKLIQIQLNIAFFWLLCQIFIPICMPEGAFIAVNGIANRTFFVIARKLLALCGNRCIFPWVIPAAVFWILYRFRIQVDGIAAAGGVIF